MSRDIWEVDLTSLPFAGSHLSRPAETLRGVETARWGGRYPNQGTCTLSDNARMDDGKTVAECERGHATGL